MSNLKCSLCWLALPSESLDCTTLIGVQPQVQPLFVSSTKRITWLHYTYRCATLRAPYVSNVYLYNHWVRVYLRVRHLKCSLCLLALPTESLANTILIGAPPWGQPLLVSSTFRNTGLRYTSGCPSLSGGYVCKVFLQNHCVRVHLLVRHLKCSLCL